MITRNMPYTDIKIKGVNYSYQDLLFFSELKINDETVPDWEKSIYRFILEWIDNNDSIGVNTSGSTGSPKLIWLKKTRMLASAMATNSFFQLDSSKKVLLCLSSDFIAGKMMIVRAFVGGFDLHYIEPSSTSLLSILDEYDFAAAVPFQLETAFKSENSQILNNIKRLIVGGAAVRSDLMAILDYVETEIWATYGMTETITHVALQALNGRGKKDYFKAIEGVEFEIDERDCLKIFAPNISPETIQTNDRVDLINAKEFRFLGRIDFVINSGGIKFSPENLEQKIASYLERNFVFSAVPDADFGEKLVLVIEGPRYIDEIIDEIKFAMKKELSRFEQPKEVLFIPVLPKNENGKLDRNKIKQLISKK